MKVPKSGAQWALYSSLLVNIGKIGQTPTHFQPLFLHCLELETRRYILERRKVALDKEKTIFEISKFIAKISCCEAKILLRNFFTSSKDSI